MAQEVIEAPLPGRIVRVEVAAGERVVEGGVICIIEAMKMENPILSPVEASVVEVGVLAGQTVRTGDKIAVIEY
jgi:glutaconyl-CoA/methylmalonyl-CoA decarboxylase subunit gamma